MKKCIALIVLIVLIFVNLISSSKTIFAEESSESIPSDLRQLYAKSLCLMDADSGRILFSKNENALMPMASTTKIMTCILALEYGNLESLVGISEHAASMPNVQLNAHKGEYFKLGDLLYSLMLESHNDSAVAIAEYIGSAASGREKELVNNSVEQSKEAVLAFTQMMNQKARDIGCYQTYFITPNGLDASEQVSTKEGTITKVHATTAEELARIMSYCIGKSPSSSQFLEITRTPSYNFTNISGDGNPVQARSFSCNNHNAFLKMMEGALSGKTGFTADAGYCYVGALQEDGKTFVVALLACGWPNNKSYKWSDTKRLMRYGIENYILSDMNNLREPELAMVTVNHAKTDSLETSVELMPETEALTTEKQTVLLKKEESVDVVVKMKTTLEAPVEERTCIGNVLYYVNGYLMESKPILITEKIDKVDYPSYLLQTVRLWCKGFPKIW